MHRLLLQFIIHAKLSFSVVDDPYFHALMERILPGVHLPTRWTISRAVPQLWSTYLAPTRRFFSDSRVHRYVCIQDDGWTPKGSTQGFLTVSARFISPDWVWNVRDLATQPFDGRHTADVVSPLLSDSPFSGIIPKD